MSSDYINPEQIIAEINRLQQLLGQQAQPSSATTPTIETDEDMVSAHHSLNVRPSYAWEPSEMLSQLLHFDRSFFTSELLPERERRDIIERYPGMKDVEYQLPDTIPLAARNMKKQPAKQKHDMSLKRLQYLASGVFRPLDVLALEISRDHENPNVQRYLQMLADARLLLLNLSAQMNEMRNSLAFQTMNPSFTSPSSSSDSYYTMSLSEFQAGLAQQTTAAQIYSKATYNNKKPRFNQQPHQQQGSQFNNSNNSQFFRPGPSSQQGGFNQRSSFNFKPNNRSNNSSYNNQKKNTNPFRNNQQ